MWKIKHWLHLLWFVLVWLHSTTFLFVKGWIFFPHLNFVILIEKPLNIHLSFSDLSFDLLVANILHCPRFQVEMRMKN